MPVFMKYDGVDGTALIEDEAGGALIFREPVANQVDRGSSVWGPHWETTSGLWQIDRSEPVLWADVPPAANGNAVAMESITLAHEGLELS
jgi:hypothetical protein